MIKYSNGQQYKPKNKHHFKKSHVEISLSSANRGMDLEDDINSSNQYYKDQGICLIYKRPTPINVVKVDYSRGAIITKAYFEEQSTTDYNGIFRGKYVDFEAKNTKNKTSFPLSNISPHQIEHLRLVQAHGGIAFFIIQFELLNEIFMLDSSEIISFINNEKRKSIPHDYFKKHAIQLERAYNPRIKYIDAVIAKYF